MSAETRLRHIAEVALNGRAIVETADLRTLLDAYDEAMKAGQTVVECADEMREEWAETEERLIAERDTARAEGVAEERARVVAWLRADAERGAKAHDDKLVVALHTAAFLIERGEHDKEGT